MERIRVSRKEETPDGWKFTVEVGENTEKVGFSVSLTKDYWERITERYCDPETFVYKSFQLLLTHVPKVVIRRDLHIDAIEDYFPEGEYEEEIRKRIAKR